MKKVGKINKKKRLRTECDKLWHQLVVKRAGGKCEVCGDTFGVVGHHYYHKSTYGHIRYDLDNGIALCRSCHFLLHHQDPKRIEEKIETIKGKKWREKLKKKSQNRPKNFSTTIGYYEEIKTKLKKL